MGLNDAELATNERCAQRREPTMPKYLCMQRSVPAPDPQPTQAGGNMEDWYAAFQGWMKKFEDNLVDMGGKLGEGRLVTSDSKTDAPLVEVKELVGGYMIVSAESLDQAIEVASACPGLVKPGSGVEVIEIHTP